MFSPEFLSVDPAEIAAAVEEKGLFFMPRALDAEFVERLLGDVDKHRFGINRNWVSGVYAHRQYYLTHMLACSQAFADIVTTPKVTSVCDSILGDSYRLKAMRYYETYGKHRMQWHTDNKTGRGKVPVPGLIFIVYLADVEDGEFQYVLRSHKWSGATPYSDYSEEYVSSLPPDDVVSVRGPKGTVAIYNTYGIHRARPVERSNFVRKSLFFQIDADMTSAEPLLLNPAYIKNPDSRTLQYLGFGLPTETGVFPSTDLATLPLGGLRGMPLGKWLIRRAARAAYENSPARVRRLVKGVLSPSAENTDVPETGSEGRG